MYACMYVCMCAYVPLYLCWYVCAQVYVYLCVIHSVWVLMSIENVGYGYFIVTTDYTTNTGIRTRKIVGSVSGV